jgi:hypothetical protein
MQTSCVPLASFWNFPLASTITDSPALNFTGEQRNASDTYTKTQTVEVICYMLRFCGGANSFPHFAASSIHILFLIFSTDGAKRSLEILQGSTRTHSHRSLFRSFTEPIEQDVLRQQGLKISVSREQEEIPNFRRYSQEW